MSNTEWLKNIRVGDPITAEFLNMITQAVNRNTQAVRNPRQINDPDDENQGGTNIGNEVFNSTSVTETTVTHTDSGGDTVDVERVDSIVLQEATTGRTITLNITYPP